MLKSVHLKGKRRKGFMLLELILVVAIVGILTAVAIPHLTGITDEAKVARIQTDLTTIGSATELYYVRNGKYPMAVSDLVSTDDKEGFLKSEPMPPVKDSPYILNHQTGEVTCSFKGVEYSSFGKKGK